jgi:hypothetical protein
MQLITAIPRNGLRFLEIKNELDTRNLGLLIRYTRTARQRPRHYILTSFAQLALHALASR